MHRNLVWPRREGSRRDKQRSGRGEWLATCGALGPTSPDLSRVFMNSWHSASPARRFHADSTKANSVPFFNNYCVAY